MWKLILTSYLSFFAFAAYTQSVEQQETKVGYIAKCSLSMDRCVIKIKNHSTALDHKNLLNAKVQSFSEYGQVSGEGKIVKVNSKYALVSFTYGFVKQVLQKGYPVIIIKNLLREKKN